MWVAGCPLLVHPTNNLPPATYKSKPFALRVAGFDELEEAVVPLPDQRALVDQEADVGALAGDVEVFFSSVRLPARVIHLDAELELVGFGVLAGPRSSDFDSSSASSAGSPKSGRFFARELALRGSGTPLDDQPSCTGLAAMDGTPPSDST